VAVLELYSDFRVPRLGPMHPYSFEESDIWSRSDLDSYFDKLGPGPGFSRLCGWCQFELLCCQSEQ
ncbi:hypothetical protein CHS0354_018235, partial [Potamilus streckersoni]